MNKVILRGNVSTKPRFLYEEDPNQICSFFNIAVPDYSRKKDGGGYQADFIDCAAFKQNAVKVQNHIQIGAEIIIEGSWHTYIDPKTKAKKNQCIVTKLEYISSKPISQSSGMTESGFLSITESELAEIEKSFGAMDEGNIVTHEDLVYEDGEE